MLKPEEWIQLAADPDQPMSSDLRSRLRSIPQQMVTCRDTDRLYSAARQLAAGDVADSAAAAHLADCQGCRELVDALRSAFEEAPVAAPAPLFTNLRRIGRLPRRQATPKIAGPRVAIAACVLMTLSLSSMTQEAAALLRDAGGTVGTTATGWAEAGEDRGRRMWQSAADASITSYEISREQVTSFAEACQMFFQQTVRVFESLADYPDNTPDGGQPDGKPNTQSE